MYCTYTGRILCICIFIHTYKATFAIRNDDLVYIFIFRTNVSWIWIMKRGGRCFGWYDGTSRNDVSLCICSGTPSPQINRPWWHNVPALMHPCHYALCKTNRLMAGMYQWRDDGRDVCIPGSQEIRTGTHLFVTSRHPTEFYIILFKCTV
jgi:hypothetical protein